MAKLNKILFVYGKKFYANSARWQPELRRMLFRTRMVDVSEPDVIEIINEMSGIYAKASIMKNKKTYSIEPELKQVFETSRDFDEILWAWQGWHDTVGIKLRGLFEKSVDLENEYARKYGYKDLSEKWIQEFEINDFEKVYDELYGQIRPFYQHLHAYVRRK